MITLSVVGVIVGVTFCTNGGGVDIDVVVTIVAMGVETGVVVIVRIQLLLRGGANQ